MKVKAVERELKRAGYELVRQKGSHRQDRHPTVEAVITVSGKSLPMR